MHVNSAERMKTGTAQSGLKIAAKQTTGCSSTSTYDAGSRAALHENGGCKRILHLFSGPSDRPDSFANAVRALGSCCTEFDIVNCDEQNLVNDAVWQRVISDIRAGVYDGMLAGPPCNTYTEAHLAMTVMDWLTCL